MPDRQEQCLDSRHRDMEPLRAARASGMFIAVSYRHSCERRARVRGNTAMAPDSNGKAPGPESRLTMVIMRSVITGSLVLLMLTMGCSGGIELDPAQINVGQGLAIPYRIHPGDVLDIKFKYHPADDTIVTVDTNGRLFLPVTGDIQVAELLVPEIEALIREKSSRFLRDPVVSVTVAQSQARAYIGGEVIEEGFVTLMRPTTVLQAIMERGGFTTIAKMDKVVVLSHQEGRPVAREIDLKAELSGDPTDRTLLVADEIVYVPMTGIGKANKWMDQYVNKMTPEFLTRMIRLQAINP